MSNNTSNQKTVNVNNVAIPIATIISLLGFVMWATFEFAKDRQALKDELQKAFSTELRAQREIIEQIKGVIISIRERQTYYLENVWTKKDHMLWCYETQKRNSTFNCPDYNSWKDHGLLGGYEKQGFDPRNQQRENMSNQLIQTWTNQNKQVVEDSKTKKE